MKAVEFKKSDTTNMYFCNGKEFNTSYSGTYYKAEDVEECLIGVMHSIDDFQGNREDWRGFVKKQIKKFES